MNEAALVGSPFEQQVLFNFQVVVKPMKTDCKRSVLLENHHILFRLQNENTIS